jgi:hypothetical protein
VDTVKFDHREIGWGGMDWIDMVQEREQWRAFVNMVMKIHKMLGSSWKAAQLAACQERLSSMKFIS